MTYSRDLHRSCSSLAEGTANTNEQDHETHILPTFINILCVILFFFKVVFSKIINC